MAFSKALPFVAMLFAVLPAVAMADIDGNLNSIYDRLCQEVDCGKGTCVGDISYPLSYKCQCQTGWKQTQYDDVNDEHKFLPCVIPNCTLNYGTCQPAPPASQPHLQFHKTKFPITAPSSIVITITRHLYSHNQILKIMLSLEYPPLLFFLSSLIFCPDDHIACYWMYCGDGTCTNKGTYRHMCSCNPGFSNLLNTSYFPCYSQCTLGSDCSEIIRVASSTAGGTGNGTTGTGTGATPGGNPASTILPGKFQWMIILFMFMLMALK